MNIVFKTAVKGPAMTSAWAGMLLLSSFLGTFEDLGKILNMSCKIMKTEQEKVCSQVICLAPQWTRSGLSGWIRSLWISCISGAASVYTKKSKLICFERTQAQTKSLIWYQHSQREHPEPPSNRAWFICVCVRLVCVCATQTFALKRPGLRKMSQLF